MAQLIMTFIKCVQIIVDFYIPLLIIDSDHVRIFVNP
jgi:hypothetical protein